MARSRRCEPSIARPQERPRRCGAFLVILESLCDQNAGSASHCTAAARIVAGVGKTLDIGAGAGTGTLTPGVGAHAGSGGASGQDRVCAMVDEADGRLRMKSTVSVIQPRFSPTLCEHITGLQTMKPEAFAPS